jgi:hypothetical protein
MATAESMAFAAKPTFLTAPELEQLMRVSPTADVFQAVSLRELVVV